EPELELVRGKPQRRWRRPFWGGLVLFALSYDLSTGVGGTENFSAARRALGFVPVAGAVAVGAVKLRDGHLDADGMIGYSLLIADGALQLAGIAAFIAGEVLRRREEPSRVQVAPLAFGGGAGLAVSGRF